MNVVLKWSVILAALVAMVSLGLALTGLHTNPMAGFGFVVLAIIMNLVVVFMALRETAGKNTYGKQLVNSLRASQQ